MPVNYASAYAQELANAYPYVLNFGALYNTENNQRYRWLNARTVEIPSVTTTGRVDGSRETITLAARNYESTWTPKTLKHNRKWSTLVDPKDVIETNYALTIANITKAFNEDQKFPEMDAYLLSTVLKDWTALGKTADETTLTAANVLEVFDSLMLAMDDARVPVNGRILYVTHKVKKLLKTAEGITRNMSVNLSGKSGKEIDRTVSRLDEVEVVGVPEQLMKSSYDFSSGWKVKADADTVNMMLIHPSAIITPVNYEQAYLDAPSGMSEGKYVYYEESNDDVFVLDNRADGIQFNITKHT